MNDDDDNISDATDDLLAEMLGGITFDKGEWIEEDEDANVLSNKATTNTHGRVTGTMDSSMQTQSPSTLRKKTVLHDFRKNDGGLDSAFDYSYRCPDSASSDKAVQRAPLQIVQLEGGRGNGLVVTVPIPRGSILYTERAAVATQIPPFNVRACQHCFQSLEPIERLSEDMPHPDLWPVSKIQFKSTNNKLQVDKFGRVQCQSCKSLFCTMHHHDVFEKEMGNCCRMSQVYKAIKKMDEQVQAPVVLASRLFVHCIEYYRRYNGKLDGHFLEGICGQTMDVNALELGVQDINGNFTLQPLYDQLIEILNLSTDEQDTLSLFFLHKVASQAGRNGFGIRTQSPFKTYYAGLLRKSISRDSPAHEQNMKKVANALGQSHLERGMDRVIEEKVAPEICAIFPLTARCNHSCDPNAQVRAQEFVDARIDLIALRDLNPGEELLISYIPAGGGVGKRSATKRRRELQAKYLFYCDCALCTAN